MHVHIDFETKSACDLKKCGADIYARHESTDVWCMAYAFDDEEPELWVNKPGTAPIDVLLAVENGATIMAHNAPFELAIWNRALVKKYGWPELNPDNVICTMAMAYAMAIPASLEKAAFALGVDQKKDMVGSRIAVQLSQPRKINPDGSIVWWDDAEKFKILYEYCKQDVRVEQELFKRMMLLTPQERKIWALDYKINQRGVYVDIPSAKKAIKLVEAEKWRLNNRMRAITQNQVATCNAVGQLIDWLRTKGVAVDSVAKASLTDLLATSSLPPECREALLIRQEAAKSSTAKLEAMINGTHIDNRSRGLFQYHGANTGRWAGRRIQLQNLPRPNLSQAQIDEVFNLLEETVYEN